MFLILPHSDLDYEALTNEEQGQGFALLIQDLRTAFDKLARKKKDKTPYLVTAATGAGSNEFLNLTALGSGSSSESPCRHFYTNGMSSAASRWWYFRLPRDTAHLAGERDPAVSVSRWQRADWYV